MDRTDQIDIKDLMDRYFEGLYHSDSMVLRTVFHTELSYVNATIGNHEFMGLEAYMDRIDHRMSPASRNDERNEVLEKITLKGGNIGVVEARMTMLGRDYQDLLTIIQSDNEWRVLTKVFTHIERKG